MKVKDLIQMLSRFDGEAELDIQTDNYELMDVELNNFNGHPTLVVFPALEEPDNE